MINLEEAHTLEDVQRAHIDQSKAKWIAGVLEKAYPGYLWAVNADTRNNICSVNALTLSGEWGFYLHLSEIDATGKKAKEMAGELLERYRVVRGAIDVDQVLSIEKDFKGEKKVDRS